MRSHCKTSKEVKRYAVALDVGGTFIKSAVVGSDGSTLKGTFKKVPVDSQGPAEPILETFVRSIGSHLRIVGDRGLELDGIGAGMPGPFDYERGISLMEHKFGSIRGLNLRHELIKRLGLREDFPIRFENDAWVFLRGEAWLGVARGFDRVVGLTLGTGLGSAFMAKGEIVVGGQEVPPGGDVYNLPYEGGIVEDRISRRWIISRYKELAGKRYRAGLDVRDIAAGGKKHGDEASIQTFEEMGRRLGQVLKPILSKFRAECLVMGGQISNNFALFSKPLKEELRAVPTLRKITPARRIDLSPIYGAARLVFLGPSYKFPRAL